MARRLRSPIDNRTARLALKPRGKPYHFTSVAPGIGVGYRRLRDVPGTWVLRASDGKGGYTTARVGVADDYEPADNEYTLDFWEAAARAKRLARGQTADSARPLTVASALDGYEDDLRASGRDPVNASRVRGHMPPTLLTKSLLLVNAADFRRWQNDLRTKVTHPTVGRICRAAKAAFNFAADHDPRIVDRSPWKIGLSGGPADSHHPVNRVINDVDVSRLVEAAYGLDQDFGAFIEVLAVCGCRASQAARLLVADLQLGPEPKLLMPSSRKGRRRQIVRRPVPISASLAAKLAIAAGDRVPDEPLLLDHGEPWQAKRIGQPFALIAEQCGIDETSYCLRHAAITRALLAGVPLQLVADMFDTSPPMLSATYARYISHFGDKAARRGLLDLAASPAAGNVVPMPRGR
jgi:integrase